jgi:hypothetical protein
LGIRTFLPGRSLLACKHSRVEYLQARYRSRPLAQECLYYTLTTSSTSTDQPRGYQVREIPFGNVLQVVSLPRRSDMLPGRLSHCWDEIVRVTSNTLD